MAKQQFGSQLLIAEVPLQYLPSLAEMLGDRPAVFLQQVHYKLDFASKQTKGKFGKFENGRWWVYMSLSDWQEEFHWPLSTVKRVKTKLLKVGIMLCQEEIDLRAPGGARSWYSIDYARLDELKAKHRRYAQSEPTPTEGRMSKVSHPPAHDGPTFTESSSENTGFKESDPDSPVAKSGPPAALAARSSISSVPERNSPKEKRVKAVERRSERIFYEDLTPLGKCVVDVCGKGTKLATTPNLTGTQVDDLAAEWEVPFNGEVLRVTPSDLFEADPLYKQWIETEVYVLLRAQGGDKPLARGKMVDAITMGGTVMNLGKFLEWKEQFIEEEKLKYALAHAETTPEIGVSLLAGIDDMDDEDELDADE